MDPVRFHPNPETLRAPGPVMCLTCGGLVATRHMIREYLTNLNLADPVELHRAWHALMAR